MIASVTGASGVVGGADPVLQIAYADPDCDVTGGLWEGAEGSGLSQQFTGGCSAGSGVATYARTCAWAGVWTEFSTSRGARGRIGVKDEAQLLSTLDQDGALEKVLPEQS